MTTDLDARRRRAEVAALVTLAFTVIEYDLAEPDYPSRWEAFIDGVCELDDSDDNLRLTIVVLATAVARVLTTLCAEDAPVVVGADARQVWSQFALQAAVEDWGDGS